MARRLRPLALIICIFALVLPAANVGAAGKKDKEANKLRDQAMDEHYLSVEFDKAEAKLKKAIETCGKDNCSPDVLGKVHIALGTVHGVGQQKLDLAKADFVSALKADPNAKLIDGLGTPELEAKFKEAQAEAGGSGGTGGSGGEGGEGGEGGDKPKPPAGGDFAHTPLTEAPVNTPVPIFAEIPEEIGATKVIIRYRPFGGEKWKSLTLDKMEGGFGGLVPCEDVTTTGDLKYYIIGSDESGTPVATAGSLKQPYKIPVKNKVAEAPSLPGKSPPKKCVSKIDCPPGMPGCGTSTGKGDKPLGSLCEETQECGVGLVCLNGECQPGDDGSGKTEETPSVGAKNLIFAQAQFDFPALASGADVCSTAQAASYACFSAGTSNQFFGSPADVNGTNGISGGLAFGGIRLLAGYDRILFDDLGLAVGGRVGVAFLGHPSPENADDAANGHGPAKDFLLFHGEARASYYFMKGGLEKGSFRPHAFVGGGVGQVDGSVPVTVCDKTSATGKECPNGQGRQVKVDAYQLAGLGFVDFGGGLTYMIVENFGVQVEAKFMIMIPTIAFVMSPTLGPVVAF